MILSAGFCERESWAFAELSFCAPLSDWLHAAKHNSNDKKVTWSSDFIMAWFAQSNIYFQFDEAYVNEKQWGVLDSNSLKGFCRCRIRAYNPVRQSFVPRRQAGVQCGLLTPTLTNPYLEGNGFLIYTEAIHDYSCWPNSAIWEIGHYKRHWADEYFWWTLYSIDGVPTWTFRVVWLSTRPFIY